MKKTKRSFFRFGSRSFRNLTIGALIFFIVVVGVLTHIVLDFNKREILNDTRNSLSSILQTTTEGLRIWIADKKIYMTQVGESAVLVNDVKHLLSVPPNVNALLESEELANVRRFFKSTQDRFGETGFFIINSDFVSIGSMRDSNIGTRNIIAEKRPDLLERVFKGETVFVTPIRSDVYLENSSKTSRLPSTSFIVAPVRDKGGHILAALARRLDPSLDFSRVIQLGRIGDSGETYAFNRNGKLLSESRFDEDLKNIGLIARDAKGILEIEIRDPGGNMVAGYQPSIPRHQQPLTVMAESAIRGEASENMQGYRDYRGVPVYGVWLWDSMLGLGITTEIDVEEALLPYRVVSWTMIGVLGVVLLLSAAGMIFTLFFGERANWILQKSRGELEEKILQRTADLRENEKKLNAALKASKAATQAKTSFLANMSHEIRTPMNAIIGFSEILIQTKLDRTQSKHLNTINRSAKSLLSLLNDILDIAKFEEGRMEIESIILNLPRVIDDVLATLSIKAQQKNLMIHLHYDPALPNCFVGDPVRLSQVLINLIGNAIKFTDAGSVALYVEPDKEKDFLHFMIKDTGIGIPKDRLDAIFAPFAQADTSTTRKYGGTGLGTTISRQIVECMKGRIWVESDEGVGSTFHFTAGIPQADCKAACEGGTGKTQTVFRSTRALKILLAEDIPENAELVTIQLETLGHHLTVAVDGLQVLKRFNQGDYDLILMDVQMPHMDGLEATREIRKIEVERGGHIPIISLSASALAQDKVYCTDAGMDGFVSKPINFDELFAEIAHVLPNDCRALASELEISPQKRLEDFPALAGIDTRRGLNNWRDPERYSQNLINFLHKHRQDGDLIKQALDKNELVTAEKISHALKGVAGNLAITHVTSIATELNAALRNRRSGYEPLLEELNRAINEVSVAIGQLSHNADEDAKRSIADFDASKLKKLMSNLLAALETDDPDNIEPVLIQLKGYLVKDQLKTIVDQIEEFSFRDAEVSTRSLARDIAIELRDEHDK